MIVVQDLSFQYKLNRPLFDGLNFSIDAPGFYSIFGKSATGKSTLGKIIAGRLPVSPFRSILVDGPALYASSDDLMPQWMTVSKNLKKITAADTRSQLTSYWHAAELSEAIYEQFPPELSLGQRQRVNLARYLLQSSPCLILDEALIGVDQPTRLRILEWIKSERKKLTTLLISHELEDVAIFSKRIIKLSASRPATITVLNGIDLDSADAALPISTYQALRLEMLKP